MQYAHRGFTLFNALNIGMDLGIFARAAVAVAIILVLRSLDGENKEKYAKTLKGIFAGVAVVLVLGFVFLGTMMFVPGILYNLIF